MLKKLKSIIHTKNWGTPDYEPEKWEQLKSGTNCYAYALGIMVPSSSHALYEVGGIARLTNSKQPANLSVHDLEQNLLADCKALKLNICPCSKNTKPQSHERLICMLWNAKEKAFHFLRLDSNGFWSHKLDWSSGVTNVYYLDHIKNPEIPFFQYGYRVAGYYLLSN